MDTDLVRRNGPHKNACYPGPIAVIRRCAWTLSLLFVLVAPWVSAIAADPGQTKTVGGMVIYIGMMPAEIVRGHSNLPPEATAHGGPSAGRHSYHVTVAVFDATNGRRIEDVKITARVAELGMAGTTKLLEPMKIADTITYGNDFSLPYQGRYTIGLTIDGPRGLVNVNFDYGHN